MEVIQADGEVVTVELPGDRSILAALARAQAEFPEIPKDLENTHFKTKYSSLDAIVSACRPVLAKHGLGFTHRCEHDGERTLCVCYLLDQKTGHMLAMDSEPLRGIPSNAQAAGSARTYARRYTLTATLGITSDEDDDGNGASGGNQPPQNNRSGGQGKQGGRTAPPKNAPPKDAAPKDGPPPEAPPNPPSPADRKRKLAAAAKERIAGFGTCDDLWSWLKTSIAKPEVAEDRDLIVLMLRESMKRTEAMRQAGKWSDDDVDSLQAHIKSQLPEGTDVKTNAQFAF